MLDHLGIAQCHLVGISTGGPVALTFAAQSPAAVESLVLADTFAKPVEGSKERVEATAEAIAYVSMEEFGTQYAAETLLPSTSLDVQDELAGVIAKVNPEGLHPVHALGAARRFHRAARRGESRRRWC